MTAVADLRLAEGQFEVVLVGREASEQCQQAQVGRRSLSKTFTGDLQAESHGEMLATMTAVEGSMAYVALEKVSGSLAGLHGDFVLQHASQMVRGEPRQSRRVGPDSGTGELVGLAGDMAIDIRDGRHYYRCEYRIQEDH